MNGTAGADLPTGSGRRDDTGAVMVEYVLLAVFIAMVALIGATALGINLNAFYEAVAGTF